MRKLIVGLLAAVSAAMLPASALADSCSNTSREPASCGWNCPSPVVDGNWVWLPSIGVQEYAWGFAPPGSTDSVAFGFPGANGNYTDGQTSSLLGVSALCANPPATAGRGLRSGCV
ncbi:MAG TPA: hypothetical protein VFD49_04380 [Candidatus Dormibacteraeota bacterium]|nr:hypothetical protein [Candidatus Dormibacteraeota bacterium]